MAVAYPSCVSASWRCHCSSGTGKSPAGEGTIGSIAALCRYGDLIQSGSRRLGGMQSSQQPDLDIVLICQRAERHENGQSGNRLGSISADRKRVPLKLVPLTESRAGDHDEDDEQDGTAGPRSDHVTPELHHAPRVDRRHDGTHPTRGSSTRSLSPHVAGHQTRGRWTQWIGASQRRGQNRCEETTCAALSARR